MFCFNGVKVVLVWHTLLSFESKHYGLRVQHSLCQLLSFVPGTNFSSQEIIMEFAVTATNKMLTMWLGCGNAQETSRVRTNVNNFNQ